MAKPELNDILAIFARHTTWQDEGDRRTVAKFLGRDEIVDEPDTFRPGYGKEDGVEADTTDETDDETDETDQNKTDKTDQNKTGTDKAADQNRTNVGNAKVTTNKANSANVNTRR